MQNVWNLHYKKYYATNYNIYTSLFKILESFFLENYKTEMYFKALLDYSSETRLKTIINSIHQIVPNIYIFVLKQELKSILNYKIICGNAIF